MVSREILIITEGFASPTGTAWDIGKGNMLVDQRHKEPNIKGQYNSLRLLSYWELKLSHGILWTHMSRSWNSRCKSSSFGPRKREGRDRFRKRPINHLGSQGLWRSMVRIRRHLHIKGFSIGQCDSPLSQRFTPIRNGEMEVCGEFWDLDTAVLGSFGT